MLKQILAIFIITCLLVGCKTDAPKQGNTEEKPVLQEDENPTITYWTKIIKENPKDHKAYFGRAQAYLEKYDPENAVLDFNQAIALDSKNSLYRKVLANYFFESQQYAKSLNTLKDAIAQIPEDVTLRLLQAKYLIYTEKYEEAFLELNIAIQLDPNEAETDYLRALAYRLQGDYDSAAKGYKVAVQKNPDHFNAFMELANLYRSRKDPQAIEYFKSAMAINPQSTEPIYDLGMFYQEQDDFPMALETYRKAIQIEPMNHLPHYNMGYLYFQMDSINKAYKSFDRTVKLKTTYAKGYYMRGLCMETQGDLKAAKDDYLQALTFDENLALAKQGVARLKEKS